MELKILDILTTGGPGMVAVVLMYLVWMKNKKASITNADIIDKIDLVSEEIEFIKDQTIKIWDSHNVKDADGVYVWHVRQSMVEEQKETKRVLQDLHLAIRDIHQAQERQTVVLEKLIDKIIGIK